MSSEDATGSIKPPANAPGSMITLDLGKKLRLGLVSAVLAGCLFTAATILTGFDFGHLGFVALGLDVAATLPEVGMLLAFLALGKCIKSENLENSGVGALGMICLVQLLPLPFLAMAFIPLVGVAALLMYGVAFLYVSSRGFGIDYDAPGWRRNIIAASGMSFLAAWYSFGEGEFLLAFNICSFVVLLYRTIFSVLFGIRLIQQRHPLSWRAALLGAVFIGTAITTVLIISWGVLDSIAKNRPALSDAAYLTLLVPTIRVIVLVELASKLGLAILTAWFLGVARRHLSTADLVQVA